MKGTIKSIDEAISKYGKPYHKIVIDDNFIFCWIGLDTFKFKEDSYVEYEFTQKGNFKNLKSIEIVAQDLKMTNDFSTYKEYFKTHPKGVYFEDFKKHFNLSEEDAESITQNMLDSFQIIIHKNKLTILE